MSLSVSYEWNGIPGIVVVAPAFKFYDLAGHSHVIEKEIGIVNSYRPNEQALYESAVLFAKSCIPIVNFWI